jgi:hypothetical protein
MSSNTKLSPEQKDLLRAMRKSQADLPRGEFKVFHYPDNRVTIGVKYSEGDNAARVFVSLASPDETKFRKKVGEYNVRYAFDDYLEGLITAGVPIYVTNDVKYLSECHEVIADNFSESLGVPIWEF